MELKSALQAALDFEKKGYSIYEETANKTKNPIVTKIFRYLSNQELIHIEELKEYIEKKSVRLRGDKLKDTQTFFSTTVSEFKQKTELSKSDIEAYETALELEQNSYDFYKGQIDDPRNKKLINFFRFLMEQENSHYELIQKMYEFIKNPIGFYTEEEKWMADGG